MDKNQNQKMKTVIIVLSILLILAIGYIGVSKYTQIQKQKQEIIYKQGAQVGYEQAIIEVANLAKTCQKVPLKVQNETIELVAIECLQKNQAQQTPIQN